jgi:hypothetical protein
MLLSKQAKKNLRQNIRQLANIQSAAQTFLNTSFSAQEQRLFSHLCATFKNLSPTVCRYFFMSHRDIWLLMSIELVDASNAHDKWALHFCRTLERMGPATLRSMSIANPGKGLYQIVQKWDSRRKRRHYEKFKKSSDQALRSFERRSHIQKTNRIERVLQTESSHEPRRRAPGSLL